MPAEISGTDWPIYSPLCFIIEPRTLHNASNVAREVSMIILSLYLTYLENKLFLPLYTQTQMFHLEASSHCVQFHVTVHRTSYAPDISQHGLNTFPIIINNFMVYTKSNTLTCTYHYQNNSPISF